MIDFVKFLIKITTQNHTALLLVLFVTIAAPLLGQTDLVKQFEGITCQQTGGKCISIKIKTDPGGRKFLYEWNMGDGGCQRGTDIEYCYAGYGMYHVALRLIDEKNGRRIEDELTKDVLVSALPQISVPEKILAGQPGLYTFSCDIPGFIPQKVYWNFGEEEYYSGTKASHTFEAPGLNHIDVLATGFLHGQYKEFCTSLPVVVAGEHNLEKAPFQDLFTRKEKQLPANGRFLQDNIHLALIDVKNPDMPLRITFDDLAYHINVKPETAYTVYAWKGNVFTKQVNFFSGSDMEAPGRWKAAVQHLISLEPEHLDPVVFKLDASTADTGMLSRNILILKQNTWLQIGMGVYTHTGGHPGRNEKLSQQRLAWLSNYLAEQGIDAKRISVFTSKEDYRLTNTCTGLGNCEVEDAALNGKSEFKVM
jgi:hypothetical protein